eukprot:m.26662 g.26662  ORF g.26662 m.26662 type:complete len:1540 (+) comp7821_c0_seq2:204-4823(+)
MDSSPNSKNISVFGARSSIKLNSKKKGQDDSKWNVVGGNLGKLAKEYRSVADREAHRKRLGDVMFSVFLAKTEASGKTDPSLVSEQKFPKLCIPDDTLALGDVERKSRGKQVVDEVYQSAVHSVLLSAPSYQEDKDGAMEAVRWLFEVDSERHQSCIEQMSTVPDTLHAPTYALVRDIVLDNVDGALGDAKDKHIVCLLEATWVPQRRRSKDSDYNRQLYDAVKQMDIQSIEKLLKLGADPEALVGKSGKLSALDRSQQLLDGNIEGAQELHALLNKYKATSVKKLSMPKDAPTSSGVFESVPVEPANVIECGDSFVIPIESMQSANLSLEIWIVNAADATGGGQENLNSAYEDLPAGLLRNPGKSDKDKGKKRGAIKKIGKRFLRSSSVKVKKRKLSSQMTADREDLTLLGHIDIPLTDISVDVKATPFNLELQFEPNQSTASPVTVKLNLAMTKDSESVADSIRKTHGELIHKVLRSSAAYATSINSPKGGKIDNTMTGLRKPFDALVNMHADMGRLNELQRAVDFFCALMGHHAETGVKMTTMLQGLDRLTRILDKRSNKLDDRDCGRLAAAVETAVTSCLFMASRPFQCFPMTDDGKQECAACIRILVLAFNCEPWQVSTMGAPVERAVPSITTATVYRAPLLIAAEEMIQEKKTITYLVMKNELTRKFGQSEFQTYKGQISQMLADAAANVASNEQHFMADGAGHQNLSESEVSQRLKDLLEAARGEMLTYTRIKSTLTREFGPSVVRKHRGEITMALIREMTHRRRGSMAGSPNHGSAMHRRNLRKEVIDALEHFAKECYAQLQATCGEKEDYPGADIVSMVKLIKGITSDLRILDEFYQPAYEQIDGLDLVKNFATWFDKLFATELRDILAKWKPKPKETQRADLAQNKTVFVFRLYDVVRSLWSMLVDRGLSPAQLSELRLSQFQVWFFPYAIEWLAQAKKWAFQLIENSLQNDTWKPVTTSDWYSASVLDVFRAIYEILEVWTRIDWPDRIVREEALFVKLVESVCGCITHYVELVEKRVGSSPEQLEALNSRQYFVPDDVCVALNNLAKLRLECAELYGYLQVDEVAAAHMVLAREANKGHSGSVKPHEALAIFAKTYEKIDSYSQKIADTIGDKLATRVEQDLYIILQQCGKGPQGRKSLFNLLHRGLLLEVDELQNPSLQPSKRGSSESLFDNPSVKTAVYHRKSKEQKQQELRSDGFLYLNLWILASKLDQEDTLSSVLAQIWEKVVNVLTDVLCNFRQKDASKQLSINVGDWLDLLLCAQSTLRDFFHQGGDGLSLSELDKISQRILTPVSACFEMESSELVGYFVAKAAENQVPVLRESIRHGTTDEECLTVAKTTLATSKTSSTDNLGFLHFRILSFDGENSRRSDSSGADSQNGNDMRSEMKSLRINITKAEGDFAQCYISASLADSDGHYKSVFKSRTSKDNVFNSGFTIRDCSADAALQLRVCNSGGSLFSWSDAAVAECYVDLRVAASAEKEVSVAMPLRPGLFPGHLGRIQVLLSNRTDKIAKAFTKIYPMPQNTSFA